MPTCSLCAVALLTALLDRAVGVPNAGADLRGDAESAHIALGHALRLLGSGAGDAADVRRTAYLWASLADSSTGQQQQDAAYRALDALQAVGPIGNDAAWWHTTAHLAGARLRALDSTALGYLGQAGSPILQSSWTKWFPHDDQQLSGLRPVPRSSANHRTGSPDAGRPLQQQ